MECVPGKSRPWLHPAVKRFLKATFEKKSETFSCCNYLNSYELVKI